jgi:hypothetical protein
VVLDPPSSPPLLPGQGCHRHIRSFAVHRDQVTGKDMLFAGTNGNADCPTRMYSGMYEPGSATIFRWSPQPETWQEPPDPDDRVLSLAEANGKLYATVCGKLYERVDGVQPCWTKIFTHPDDNCPAGPGENGWRGATPILDGAGSEYLMVAMEGWISHVGRLELVPEIAFFQELQVQTYLSEAWEIDTGYSILAYNDMTPFTLNNGETVVLMGLEAATPSDPLAWKDIWAPWAWFLIRYPDTNFEMRRILDPTLAVQPKLVATRTLVLSPFDSEQGHVLYAGGFDANHQSCHNRAWLYRGEIVTGH